MRLENLIKKSGFVVSIHAPVKGATFHLAMGENQIQVSIHAPVKGATCIGSQADFRFRFNSRTRKGCDIRSKAPPPKSRRFNSRTRKGCDAVSVGVVSSDIQVSIHAPVKGATFNEFIEF